ncbi:MAG: glycosyltransferase, partial [Candidatus Peribacteraceae bacterium]|nr:glycosyltransferase [Candidatus Peribacteraceae bacterium]
TVSQLKGARLTIAGGTITAADEQEQNKLRSLMNSLGIADRVTVGWVPPDDVPTLLQRADIFLHASEGGLDKVVLQSMASGLPLVSISKAASEVLPPECRATPDTMVQQAQKLMELSGTARKTLGDKLRAIVEKDHSLAQCIARQIVEMRE